MFTPEVEAWWTKREPPEPKPPKDEDKPKPKPKPTPKPKPKTLPDDYKAMEKYLAVFNKKLAWSKEASEHYLSTE
jgi:hypothetical protein